MGRQINVLYSGHRLLGRVLFVVAASSFTLAACNQPAAESKAAMETPATISTSQMSPTEANKANAAPATTLPDKQKRLLTTVSATVYKDANCGCCKEWVGYAEGHGLSATAHDVTDLSLFKERYGVPQQMRSCHTTVTTDGFVFEGHVPAKHMAQFLAKPPKKAIGLAVPSMPVGSPGMEYQGKFMPYKVMQLNKDGTTEVYAVIETPQQQL